VRLTEDGHNSQMEKPTTACRSMIKDNNRTNG